MYNKYSNLFHYYLSLSFYPSSSALSRSCSLCLCSPGRLCVCSSFLTQRPLSLLSDVCPLLNLAHPLCFHMQGQENSQHNPPSALSSCCRDGCVERLIEANYHIGGKKSLARPGSWWQVIVIHWSYNANVIREKKTLQYKGENN